MTDASDRQSTSFHRWRRRATRGLVTAGKASLQSGRSLLLRWRRLVAYLQDEDSFPAPYPPPPRPGRHTEQRDPAGPITVPARGYVFCFHVRATFTWSSEGLRPEALSWYAQYFMPQAIEQLTRLAAERAREFSPHRAGDMEVALQRALAEQTPWRYERGDVVVTCQPGAWVRLDQRVKQALQPHWERHIALASRYDEHLRRAQYAERLSRRWVSILREHIDGASADGAATGNEEHADALQHMLDLQEAAAEWIEDLLCDRFPDSTVFDPLTPVDLLSPPSQRQETPERPETPTGAAPESPDL
ncbi:hypothetical protein [Micromonospora sp. NPDC002717]|uniref:hypothetical protein n=1 Tax=Micromonospora sp. NPDC002717 TaxID=3154424 RepID=UPI00332E7E12